VIDSAALTSDKEIITATMLLKFSMATGLRNVQHLGQHDPFVEVYAEKLGR
jgi:hypothetical protein